MDTSPITELRTPTWHDILAFTAHHPQTIIGTYRIVHRFGMTTVRLYLDHTLHNTHTYKYFRVMLNDLYFSYSWSDAQIKSIQQSLLNKTGFYRILDLPTTDDPQPMDAELLMYVIQGIKGFDPGFFERQ